MKGNFYIEDFSLDTENCGVDFNRYVLNKDYIVFNKPVLHTDYISYKLAIWLSKKIEFSEYISNINAHLKWLNREDSKNKLISYFCDFYNEETCVSEDDYISINQMIEDKWFENLEVWQARITIKEDGKIISNFICKDDYGHITDTLIFYAHEYDFFGMNYEYMGDAYA